MAIARGCDRQDRSGKVIATARFIREGAMHLHSGIAVTDELAVGHCFKRLSSIDMTWGNALHHVERYGAYL